jgi:diguanylate cyclase (GGDEF)-like protein
MALSNHQGIWQSTALQRSRQAGPSHGRSGHEPDAHPAGAHAPDGTAAARPRSLAARDPDLAARVLAYVLAASAVAMLALAALAPGGEADIPALIGTAAAAFALALSLEVAAPFVPHRLLPWAASAASLPAGVAVYLGGASLAACSLLYLGPVVYSFSFLSPAAALTAAGVAAASLAAALALLDDPSAPVLELWVVTVAALAAAGGVVWAMRHRYEDALAGMSSAARTDPLTALLNRRGLDESFELELERARRGGRKLSLLVGDLDGFKLVNDRYGHKAGDLALERVSAILRRRKRRIDTVARLGGEEFALIVPDANDRSAYMLAERLRAATAEEFAADPLPLTISFGVASYPSHGDSCQSLMGAADDALYAAKELGRDRTVIYSREVSGILAPAGRGGRPRDERLDTLLALAETLDRREASAGPHSRRVGRYAELIARELGLPGDTIERVRLAGLLHDVGTIAIPDPLLTKPAPLTDAEWVEVRRHPEIGAHMLANARLADLGRWVLAHHERPDGRGFPLGLANGDIPLEARIIAVAEAYEAMTSDRPYRPALAPGRARAELTRNAGTQFDQRVVQALLDSLAREEAAA